MDFTEEEFKKGKIDKNNLFGLDDIELPKYELYLESIDSKLAYNLIKDELMDEGNARLNLATFCQTRMEDEALKLLSETLEKNAIDKSEYPQTTELENRCINIIADLWHAPNEESYIGTSTVGSSEACMLGGMAMKFRWREKAIKENIDINKQKPNLIISSGYQVCWKKFCVYWDIEMRIVEINENNTCLDVNKAIELIDEYTIGVVGILGITYTGKYDDIEKLDQAIESYNKDAKITVPIHVDGASGGMFAPFVQEDLKWDFKLKNVVSINTSGHKYGLVYPGIGWVLWRDKKYLPDELMFKVNYLGGELPTIAINFSRSASQIIGQYYNFLRLGFNGYKKVHTRTRNIAKYITSELDNMGIFEIYNDGTDLPIVCYKLKENNDIEWTLYDLSDRLLMKGWQVPTYTLPKNLEDVVIQRIVCRADLGHNLGEELIEDIKFAITELNDARVLKKNAQKHKTQGFTH